jgi:hypothetical protein
MHVMMALTTEALVARFNYEEITTDALLELAQFTPTQKTMAKIFWNSVFNHSWLYLSNELIRENLTNETGPEAVTHYNDQVLKKICKEGEDYIQVTKTHPAVLYYLKVQNEIADVPDTVENQSVYPPKKEGKKSTRGGALKHYFVVTGECYKSLLMMAAKAKGAETRA